MNLVEQIRREIRRALAGTRAALWGVLRSIDIAKPVQLANLEGLADEQLNGVELFQHFGFTSAPPAGSQLIVLPLGGRTSAAVVVGSENGAMRIQLGAVGEACLYNQWGDRVHMRADRTIHVEAEAKVLVDTERLVINASDSVHITTPELVVDASTVVQLNTPTVAASGAMTVGTTQDVGGNITSGANITAAGEIADNGGSKTMSGMREVFDSHDHPEHNEPTNTTGKTNQSM